MADNLTANADVRTLCREDRLKEALGTLNSMQETGIPIECHTYASLIQVCAKMKALPHGKQIHSIIVSQGFEQDVFFAERLLNMYVKCGGLSEARSVFDKTPKQNVFLWNVMIMAYVNQGFYEEALLLYYQMPLAGVKPDHYTFSCVLKACASLSALSHGLEIHAYVIRGGFESYNYVGNALVTMYGKCGVVKYAREVFDKIPKLDVISWNAIIKCYAEDGCFKEALELFAEMQRTGIQVDLTTMVTIVPLCARLGDLQRGKEIHGHSLRIGLWGDILAGNVLIDMYAKCYSVRDAIKVFENMAQRDVISWTAMISGYAENQKYSEALELFHLMDRKGVRPNAMTMSSVISVCTHTTDLEQGKYAHDYMLRNGIKLELSVENALIDMYAKCKSIVDARSLFEKISQKDVISWSTMITGYSHVGYYNEALNVFRQMQLSMKPNSVTILAILRACANLAALQNGKELHNYIIKSGLLSDASVRNALVHMYAKCQNIEAARLVFDKTSQNRDAGLWTAMIGGCGKNGQSMHALYLFHQMQQAGIEPDDVTFVAVLCACSKAGLVDEGWKYFKQMSQEYHITPNLKHYACMVDLLACAGFVEEAHNFIEEMPVEPDAAVWGALLSACRIHRRIDLGERIAKHVFELEPENARRYMLLSSIYAEADRWDGVAKVKTMMKDRGMLKNPGCSWIEIDNTVHAFLIGDRLHPQADKIYSLLDRWATRMKESGYASSTNFALWHESEVTTKEDVLCGHHEKLAIAFGLINTSPGITIRITKNLSMCIDCHEAAKFISKIVRREITVRDPSKLHFFIDGTCSCDYSSG
ncbi:pentatricopeptide repeat-containing protein At1g15510, chloroplastic [Cryptomeria japonica]|uniref:pentatricopeptide repeat-containing protein At1g15510, chloroplastic n=1 Tax=Cryptomeria japonica TaxID=3369 RepID=UPI0027DA216A|nr:pentatricopeptide repeat-containing protein At1g15510, chloroplastic [Cryptomeria japonica]